MKTMLEITRIYMPDVNEKNEYSNYRNQLQPRKRFGDSELEELFHTNEDGIMKLVEQAVSEYVNDDDLCNDDENFWPRRCELTGEWYVREIYFSEKDYLSVETAFLSACPTGKDDYLGLDVLLRYDEEAGEFIFEGDVNQSVI
ncbi:MAG: hypothetical protein NC246_13055 [Muribaculaceae bacterium]|nr:hypothetical protein [Muribaculaceae bacterium]